MSYESKVLKLYMTGGGHDKQYDVHAELHPSRKGYILYAMHGKRGTPHTRQNKILSPVSRAQVDEAFDKLVREKEKTKGYTTHTSGAPHAGINWSAAIIVPLSGPIAKKDEAAMAMHWQSTLPLADFDGLLGRDDVGVQQSPFGRRLLVRLTTHESWCVTVDTGEEFVLPAPVVKEIRTSLSGYILDGAFDGSDFLLVDAYSLADSSVLAASTCFEQRIRTLDAEVRSCGAKRLKVCPVFSGDADKYQALYQFEAAGEIQVLLRRMDLGYVSGKPARAEDAGVFVHTLDV